MGSTRTPAKPAPVNPDVMRKSTIDKEAPENQEPNSVRARLPELLVYGAVDLAILAIGVGIYFSARGTEWFVFSWFCFAALLASLAILIPRNGLLLALIDDFMEKVHVPNGRQFVVPYIFIFLAIGFFFYRPW